MAKKLRDAGYSVISPHELNEPDSLPTWDAYLRVDLAELLKCKRTVFLQGWERSKGARLEHHVSEVLGNELVFPHEHAGLFL